MREAVALLLIGFASALVPLINIEAYLGVRASVASLDSVWLLAFVAAVGQMLGKVVWYYIGASALSWGWVRRKVEKPKNLARLELWRRRTHDRPVLAAGLVLLSAFSGFPPFAVLAVLAGQLRMNLPLFVLVGLLGRWLRFAVVLGGAAWFGAWLR
ncbi:MAG TPA: VTT domain-containing protein [Nocardioides sp.]|nr:VTT domain-containing protein [Nocardioides sp.]